MDWPCSGAYNGNSFHCQSENKNSSYLDLHSVTKVEYQFENKQFTRLSKKESEKNNILNDKAMC